MTSRQVALRHSGWSGSFNIVEEHFGLIGNRRELSFSKDRDINLLQVEVIFEGERTLKRSRFFTKEFYI